MTDYFQYVHNLKGISQFDHLSHRIKDYIVTLYLEEIENCNTLESAIINQSGAEAFRFINRYVDLKINYKSTILSTEEKSYTDNTDFDCVSYIINLKRINYTRHLNSLFRSINTLLPPGGIYIGCVETYGEKKCRILRKYGWFTSELIWILDYAVNRVFPRVKYINRFYYLLNRKNLHTISTAEFLGRLVACGFSIIDFSSVNGLTYFIARKREDAGCGDYASYYPLIGIRKIGQGGRVMKVLKLRTMHPYSEYIQDYVIRRYGYDETGKPANDFRITKAGRLLRRFYIDELPQLFQILTGEMKLVGLRPLSRIRLEDFPEELKIQRLKYKPGCIAPYISLNMSGNTESIEADRIYIKDYNRRPYLTDFRYFFMAFRNIILNRVAHS